METVKEYKHKLGDRVRIINYGHPIWQSKQDYPEMAATCAEIDRVHDIKFWWGVKEPIEPKPLVIDPNAKPKNIISETETHWICDLNPHIVGLECNITNHTTVQGKEQYAVQFDDGNGMAWFSNNQLEAVPDGKRI